jgi:hypothetical protein
VDYNDHLAFHNIETGSVYAVVAITIERYTTIRQINKDITGKFLISFIIFFSISYNIVKFFELTVDINVKSKVLSILLYDLFRKNLKKLISQMIPYS